MPEPDDRLYELLPVVYRQRDGERGHPLRDLLRVIAAEVTAVEDDITRLYENLFIETCDPWVVPYLGDLVGYPMTANRAPRRDVANFVRAQRRAGTAALLELLAGDTASLPARAVEFFMILGHTQALRNPRSASRERGRFADLRDVNALDLLESPFDPVAHTADVRNATASRLAGRHNIPHAALFAWRLRPYPLTNTRPTFMQSYAGAGYYTFSPLGNDAPLFTNPLRETDPTTIAGQLNVPAPIRRLALERNVRDFYGRSFTIARNGKEVPAEAIIAADLSAIYYRPPAGKIAVDPQLGRFAVREASKNIRVSFHYGFSDDLGGGEYIRTLHQPREAVVYRVGPNEQFEKVAAAVTAWQSSGQAHGVVEIAGSEVYTETIAAEVAPRRSLQIRAANGARPVIRVLDSEVSEEEGLIVTMGERARFTLDGIVLSGRPLRIIGKGDGPVSVRVAIRHCTLVPGWTIEYNCKQAPPPEASLDLENLAGRVTIDRSILGTIAVMTATGENEPLRIEVRDSILDARVDTEGAVIGSDNGYAYATVSFIRCTVIGTVRTHAIELAENSIFTGVVRVARSQLGCMRFCYVIPPPESRTPRRYHCEPETAVTRARAQGGSEEEVNERIGDVRLRVQPRFTSTRYGTPAYAQLAFDAPAEISRGADDESEMGAFHDLFLPQRAAALRARVDDYTPAVMETAIIYAT